jgi:hypothetical protein
MNIRTISSTTLALSDIPSDDASIDLIEGFALTFDGYSFWGSFDACSEQSSYDCDCIDHVRTRLFVAQRAGRQSDGMSRERALPLLALLRRQLDSGTLVSCALDAEVDVLPVFGIVDILRHFGFDATEPAKLVRHQDKRYDIHRLIETGWFHLYQSCQKNDVFGKCSLIIVFTSDGGTRSRFLGVYRVLDARKRTPDDIPPDCPYQEWAEKDGYFYELQREPQYSPIEGRVVIDWGTGALAWHQHIRNKEIIEIDAPGRFLSPFTDYLGFSNTFFELQRMISEPNAHRDWHSSLTSVSGIYLIVDENNGGQYVGSAYGTEGIWGRWSTYAATGHGGNKCLQKLMDSSNAYPSCFRFSILQVLPKSMNSKEIIRWETIYKRKLGSRVTGLNAN